MSEYDVELAIMAANFEANKRNRPTCPECKNEIDVDICHCGEALKNHNTSETGHSFVPMGCVCGYGRKSL